ncbi:ABC transporter [Archaeoglobales archaeon]|nr:MAG: ABC transporter [Archaeoglobales archaeon]
MTHIIELKNLWKKFDKRVAIRDVNLEIEEGEKVAIVGPNGAGKTTLLKLILGQLKPSRGEVRVFGFKPWKRVEVRKKIGFVSHHSYLYRDLTAIENLSFYAKLYRVDKVEIQRILKVVGLYDHRNKRVSSFSKGMEQRLAIARMLLANPEILLLDELTAGLDLEGKNSILRYIHENFSDKTIVMVGHNFEELEKICEKGILLEKEIKAIDDLSEIKKIYGVVD